MLFCSLKNHGNPVGSYAVRLSPRARRTLEKQSVRLFLQSRVNWVIDGLHVVIDVLLSDDGRVSDYLLFNYPNEVARQQTDTTCKRQTLRFRLRYLLRCLEKSSAYFPEFSTEDVAPLLTTLEIFLSCLQQAFGTGATQSLKELTDRFARIWSCDAQALDGETAMREELSRLVDAEEIAFAELYQAARKHEQAHEPASSNAIEQALTGMEAKMTEANALQKRSVRMLERVLPSAHVEEVDAYSQFVGLENLQGARREEVLACIRYSHERHFVIARGAKSGSASLQALASTVWRENRERFKVYARLAAAPGYKDARSLAAKLYKLAAKHPAADHFVWQT